MDSESLCEFALQGRGRDVQMCEHHGHFENRFLQRAVNEGDWKYIVTEDNMDQLYNLAQDPYERHNVAGEAADARVRMRALLKREIRRHADSPYIIGMGSHACLRGVGEQFDDGLDQQHPALQCP